MLNPPLGGRRKSEKGMCEEKKCEKHPARRQERRILIASRIPPGLKIGLDGPRMDPKWSQNCKKSLQGPKLTTRWPPIPLYRPGLADFKPFLGPLQGPKINQKRDLGRKVGHQGRFFIVFFAFLVFSVFFARFLSDFVSKNR